ncbi:MAG: amidohydrolase family protein [Nitrososphaerota archaeon]
MEKKSVELVDFHVHPLLNVVNEKEFLKEVEKANLDLVVLVALDLDPGFLEDWCVRRKFLEDCLELNICDCLQALDTVRRMLNMGHVDNNVVGKLVKDNPRRFLGIGSVNPCKSLSYVKEKLKEIKKLGLIGVKLIPTLQFFNPLREEKKLKEIFDFCEEHDKIVLYHTGCDPYLWEAPRFSENANPIYLERYVREYKNVKFILAHMGSYSSKYPGIWFREAVELGKKYSNVWFDVSAVPYLLLEKNYTEIIHREIGWDRILFGSDYPVVYNSSISSLISYLEKYSYLSEKDFCKVMGLNAVRLLGL